MMKRLMKHNRKHNGFALLLTVIILSIVMLIALFIASIVAVQSKLSSDINDSTAAIYAADSGIEWELYQIRQGGSAAMPVMSNGAQISATVSGNFPNFTIRSLGSIGVVKRQLEVTF